MAFEAKFEINKAEQDKFFKGLAVAQDIVNLLALEGNKRVVNVDTGTLRADLQVSRSVVKKNIIEAVYLAGTTDRINPKSNKPPSTYAQFVEKDYASVSTPFIRNVKAFWRIRFGVS